MFSLFKCGFSLSLVSILTMLNLATVNAKDLPDPLPNNLESETANPRRVRANGKSSSREYTFKAPDSKTLSNTRQITAAKGYKVEVYGSTTDLLHQVRDIEPKAFVKGNIIQVGIFSQQNNAQNMVGKLATAGLWARIITP